MSFLALTIPATLLLAGAMLLLVVRSVRRGEFDDPEGPAERQAFDDDRCPERASGFPQARSLAPGIQEPSSASTRDQTVRGPSGRQS